MFLQDAVNEAVKKAEEQKQGMISLEDAVFSSVGQKRDNRNDDDGQRELTFAESKMNYYAEQTRNVDQRAIDFVNSDKVSLTLSPTHKDRLMKRALDGATLEEVEAEYKKIYEIERISKRATEHKTSEIDLDYFNR